MTTPNSGLSSLSDPSSTSLNLETMKARVPIYQNLLTAFASSPSNFKILTTISPTRSKPSFPPPPAKTLLILDSSFNPPTRAHLGILVTALQTTHKSLTPPPRILLLLATQNADKAPKPAPFSERLAMMEIFSHFLISDPQVRAQNIDVHVDIGITKYPYFVDKSVAISEDGKYSHEKGEEEVEQIHLIGYDTLTRLLSPKYYPPNHTLESLILFLQKHRLLVTYRADSEWGNKPSQDAFLDGISEGKICVKDGMACSPKIGEELQELEALGGKREWVSEGRIEMVEGMKGGEVVVSSTKAREAAVAGDLKGLEKLVTGEVGKWMVERRLYG